MYIMLNCILTRESPIDKLHTFPLLLIWWLTVANPSAGHQPGTPLDHHNILSIL